MRHDIKCRTATHRPAVRKRRFRHDDYVAVDLFSGFGGLTQGIQAAGFTTIMAANHKKYKVEVHEANHPEAEHWIADLVDPESSDYHSVRDLPAADLLVAGVSCVNHSSANTIKAYEQGLTLFDLDDPEFEARVTRSERDRATANCVLHYAAKHHPRMILVECTTELTSWGPAIPGRKKVGDGSTYRWWLKQFEKENYRYRVLYLNAMFFGVPQSRDRLFIAMWDHTLPEPDLDHRPVAWCARCDEVVESVWTWRTGVPPTGRVRYGEQYEYRCPRCRKPVIPTMTPSINALDLTNLGVRIGDKPLKMFKDPTTGQTVMLPLAPATMARAERCRTRFAEFPAILVPAKSTRGSERHLAQPLSTQTGQQETAILSTGTPDHTVLSGAVDNYQGAPRGLDAPLATQGGSETMGILTAAATTTTTTSDPDTAAGNTGFVHPTLVSTGVVPYRRNTIPTTHAEPMPTVTAEQIPGLLTAAGVIKNNGSIDEAQYRAHPVSDPLGTVVASTANQGLLFSGWYKQNGSDADATAPHPVSDPLGTLTARDTTALLSAHWRATLAQLSLADCYYRMLGPHEIGRGCGFDVNFPGYTGQFIVWGSARDQVDGFGNAVPPQMGTWIGHRLRASLHNDAVG